MTSNSENPRMKVSIDHLDKIKQVDEPVFLWTRVEAHIQKLMDEKLSTKQLVVSFCSLLFIIGINILVFKNAQQSTDSSLIEKLELEQSNQYYQ